jgi:hypothetical protein
MNLKLLNFLSNPSHLGLVSLVLGGEIQNVIHGRLQGRRVMMTMIPKTIHASVRISLAVLFMSASHASKED